MVSVMLGHGQFQVGGATVHLCSIEIFPQMVRNHGSLHARNHASPLLRKILCTIPYNDSFYLIREIDEILIIPQQIWT